MKNRAIFRLSLITITILLFSASIVYAFPQQHTGEMVSFFKDVNVSENTAVKGNIVALFADISIQGTVEGDVVAIFGRVEVEGTAKKDVVSVFGGITVTPSGTIERSATAVLGYGILNNGSINRDIVSILGFFPFGMTPMAMIVMLLLVFTIIKQMLAFVFSVIAIIIFPQRFDRMSSNIKQDTGKKALIGVLVYLGGFVLTAILIMTVIGAPLLALIFPVILLLEFTGNTAIKISIGRKLATVLDKSWTTIMELLMGTIIFTLLELIIIGRLFTFIMKIIGIGEVIHSRFGDEPSKPICNSDRIISTKGDEE